MGRGRRGITTSSLKKSEHGKNNYTFIIKEPPATEEPVKLLTSEDIKIIKSLSKEQLAYILFKENESGATVCLVAQPSAPHERSLAWAHQTNNTQPASLVL